MISVDDAQKSILEMIHPMGRERLGLLDCPGRVLAEDVHSSRPVPPWNNSAMDGYALRAEDVRGASRETPKALRVIEEIQAGVMATRTLGPGEATKIMTGAPIPGGADAVVLVEETERISEEEVHVFLAVREGEAIRLAGEDVKPGEDGSLPRRSPGRSFRRYVGEHRQGEGVRASKTKSGHSGDGRRAGRSGRYA